MLREVKLIYPSACHEGIWTSIIIDSSILNRRTRWRVLVSLHRRLCVLQSRPESSGEKSLSPLVNQRFL